MTNANDKWVTFYGSVIGEKIAATLVSRCQSGPPGNTAKLILYQARRLVSLADDIVKIRPGRESLQLLFLLICAEHVAKLADGFEDEGKSQHYVIKFFENFASTDDKDLLDRSFTDFDLHPLHWRRAIKTLYGVRCDVVHEGNYWDFTFRQATLDMLNQDPDVIATITLDEFRDLVVRCAVEAVRTTLDANVAV